LGLRELTLDDPARQLERQGGQLAAQLLLRAFRFAGDIGPGTVDDVLRLALRFLDEVLPERLRRPLRFLDDLLRIAARLVELTPILLEEPIGLDLRLLRRLEPGTDLCFALGEHLLD